MTTELLSLSTVLKPAQKFKVDGEEYDLLGLDHLGAEDEAEAMALFARFNLLNYELETEANVTKGKAIAERVRATRTTILTKLTTMPRDVADKLPLTQQAKLMEAVQKEVEDEESGDGAES